MEMICKQLYTDIKFHKDGPNMHGVSLSQKH